MMKNVQKQMLSDAAIAVLPSERETSMLILLSFYVRVYLVVFEIF